jgi:hypothetical protein
MESTIQANAFLSFCGFLNIKIQNLASLGICYYYRSSNFSHLLNVSIIYHNMLCKNYSLKYIPLFTPSISSFYFSNSGNYLIHSFKLLPDHSYMSVYNSSKVASIQRYCNICSHLNTRDPDDMQLTIYLCLELKF